MKLKLRDIKNTKTGVNIKFFNKEHCHPRGNGDPLIDSRFRGNDTTVFDIASKFTAFFFMLIFFAFARDLPAIEIKTIILIGSSIDINIDDIIEKRAGDFTREEIESIGARITDEYQERGYTTSYVEKLIVKADGRLEIHIRESRIAGLKISGVDEKEERGIKAIIAPEPGEIYNRFILEKRAEDIKKRYKLDSVKLHPVNYEDSADVFLAVKAEKRSRGNFYGGINVEPVYGITPELGYIYPFDDSGINLFARAGYRDGSFRKVEGNIIYFTAVDESDKAASSVYFGVNSCRQIDIWMSRDTEYTTLSVNPAVGMKYAAGYIILDVSAGEIISNIKKYRHEDENINDYDTRLIADADFSNRRYMLNSRDVSGIRLTASGGISGLEEKGYLTASCRMKGVVSPLTSLRFIPRINCFYTTSDERFYWNYVYNIDLLGFPEDYTASNWKNGAALDIEYEITPDFLFAGPFVNSGLFRDEAGDWKTKTGGGVKCELIYKKVSIDIYFAWDLSKSASDGGLYVLAGGRF